MSKKNKNKIFEQQSEQQTEEEKVVDAIFEGVAKSLTRDTKLISPNEKIVLTKDIDDSRHFDLVPDEANESMVENVPDDPPQMDLLNDKLSQISQLTAELNVSKQKILELKAQIEKLQADNDQLVMKLADATAKNAELVQIPLQVQFPSGKTANVVGQSTSNVVSKRVNYIHTNYINNGYGTWH